MTVMKIIGSVTAVIAAYLIGDLAADKYRKRVALLTELKLFADKACRQISEYKMPLDEIVLSDEMPILTEYGFFDYISSGSEPSGDLIAVLKESEGEALTEFARSFGKLLKDEQIKMCRSFGETMTEALEKAKKECDTKTKIYRSVPPLSVTSLIILIL